MNNYLSTIAARTLNPDSAVRPRLRGRFEPARALREPAIDPLESFPRTASKSSKPYSYRGRADERETADRREFDRQPGDLFDRAPPLDIPRAIIREVNVVAPAPDTFDDRPSLLTIRAPNNRPSLEFPRENLHVDVRPVDKVITVAGKTESPKLAPPQSNTENPLEPRLEKLPSKSVSFDHQGAEKGAAPTPTRRSLTINKRSLSRDGKEKRPAQLIVPRQPVVERQPETIVIREEPTFDESRRHRQPSSPSLPREVVTSSDTSEPESPSPSRTFAQSQIEPLIEARPELPPLNRDHIQPEPIIHVTIGRLEVRAVQSPQPAARPRAASQAVMNLDDYLRRRSQGDAR